MTEEIWVTNPVTRIQRKIKVDVPKKSGMYGEMPVILIGKYTIAEMSNNENQNTIWIEDKEEGIGGEFSKELFYKMLDSFFNKHF